MRQGEYRMVEGCRVKDIGEWSSDASYGNNGVFVLPHNGILLFCISSDEGEWDHVSVSVRARSGVQIMRCPTWDEMCFVKDMFFLPEEFAIQYHPPKSDYVNNHPYVLHLWRCQKEGIAFPPKEFV